MNLMGIAVILGLAVGIWAHHKELRPPCDSPEAEEAATVALDYLNAQHTHFYKYALNRIEDIKVLKSHDGNDTFVMEVELLETDCHVMDPTPIANCTVRPKRLTAIEGDCDVVLKKVGGVLTVMAFKCKTEESTEDICLGCPTLLPLNHTMALDFVQASLERFNNRTENLTFTVQEVGRMSAQIVAGEPKYAAEFVVIESTCTNGTCEAMNETTAAHGICSAEGLSINPKVDCTMFPNLVPFGDNSTAAVKPRVHVHVGGLSPKHGLRHHKLTALHAPQLSGLLSESDESVEVVPVAPTGTAAAPAGTVTPSASANPASTPADTSSASDESASAELSISVVKRDIANTAENESPTTQAVPVCPGKIRFF